jgi:hypothetical protein
MVAVIFLDIDGVICCNMAGRLEESKLAILADVVKKTQAKVVLSTDWRRQANLKRQVVAALNRLDIEVIGATPMKPMFSPIRPTEINEWMRENRDKVGVDQWVAIDDRDLVNEQGGRELVGHFVHTHPASGLTKRLADMAVEILSGGSPMAPGPGEATGFGKLSAALANTAPAVMGGAMAAAKGTFAGPSSPLRSKLSATPGGAAAAPSTLNAVRAVQAGAKSPIGAGGLLAAATSARTPTHGTAAPASPGTPGTKLTSKIRAASPPKRWSGTSPLALGAGGAD